MNRSGLHVTLLITDDVSEGTEDSYVAKHMPGNAGDDVIP